MRFYLKVINPIVAIIVLGFCLWAATTDNKNIDIFAIFKGGLKSYFFAKGLFCASSLFILGKILETILISKNK